MEYARRTVIAVGGSLLTAGCIGNFTGGVGDRGGGIRATPVEEKPEDAPETDVDSIENSYLRDAVTRACESSEETGVRVPPEDFENVEREYSDLPGYSAPAGSEAPSGMYVDCNGGYVVVELLVED